MHLGSEIDVLLEAALAGAALPSSTFDEVIETADLVSRLRFHGVAGLIAKKRDVLASFPPSLVSVIETEAQRQAITEASRRLVLQGMVDALADAGVEHLLLKGARLAYSLYDDAADRARGDTDVLVREDQRLAAGQVLRKLGFTHMPSHRDGLYQETWVSAPEFGMRHEIDLHWRMSNSPALAALFSANFFADAVTLPMLSSHARGIGNGDLLLHLTLNQAWHESNGLVAEGKFVQGARRLGWAFDIHLLAQILSASEWEAVTEGAVRSGAAPVLLRALSEAERRLGTQMPAEFMAQLRAAPGNTWLARYIAEPDFGFRLRQDVRAANGAAEKFSLLRWHMLPPEERLRERFPDKASWPVWTLQLLRIAAGPVRWMRQTANR